MFKNGTKHTYEQVEESYLDMLNDLYREVKICGYTYNAANALRRLDPIAYREGLLNFINDNYVEDEDYDGVYWVCED